MPIKRKSALVGVLLTLGIAATGLVWVSIQTPDAEYFDYGPHHAEMAVLEVFSVPPTGADLIFESVHYYCDSGVSAPRRVWQIRPDNSWDEIVEEFTKRAWQEGLGVFHRYDGSQLLGLLLLEHDHPSEILQQGVLVALLDDVDSGFVVRTYVRVDGDPWCEP